MNFTVQRPEIIFRLRNGFMHVCADDVMIPVLHNQFRYVRLFELNYVKGSITRNEDNIELVESSELACAIDPDELTTEHPRVVTEDLAEVFFY